MLANPLFTIPKILQQYDTVTHEVENFTCLWVIVTNSENKYTYNIKNISIVVNYKVYLKYYKNG